MGGKFSSKEFVEPWIPEESNFILLLELGALFGSEQRTLHARSILLKPTDWSTSSLPIKHKAGIKEPVTKKDVDVGCKEQWELA